MGFARFCASVEDVHALGWLLTTVWLWTRETSVSCHNSTEPSLTPTELGSSPFLDTFNRVKGVLASRRTVAHNLTGSIYHENT